MKISKVDLFGAGALLLSVVSGIVAGYSSKLQQDVKIEKAVSEALSKQQS